jgi:hypothetical protein
MARQGLLSRTKPLMLDVILEHSVLERPFGAPAAPDPASRGCGRTPQLHRAGRKSSYSDSSATCVEVTFIQDTVATRDSKNVNGPVLEFPATAWARSLRSARV